MEIEDEKILSDLYRYHGDVSRRSLYTNLLKNPGFRYTYCLRKLSKNSRKRFKIPFYFWLAAFVLLENNTRMHMSYTTPIGHGFYIGYAEFITITPEAVVGNNVNIHHGAIIGQANRGRRKGVPTIGDNVWIGTHAVVVGNVTIGDNVLIAPLTHVNFDVPSNAVVAGNPGKIISYSGTEGYIDNPWT